MSSRREKREPSSGALPRGSEDPPAESDSRRLDRKRIRTEILKRRRKATLAGASRNRKTTSRLGAASTSRLREAKERAQAAEGDLEEIKKDLDVASAVQVNLLPKNVPQIPGYDIAAFYRPSKEVGGDYYDFISISPARIGIAVADVSGKGIAGSMVMAMFRSVLRMSAQDNIRARETLIRTNELASRDIKRGMFVTCLYTILNVETNSMRVCSAGHNPMILRRGSDGTIRLINPGGIAIGFDKGPVFENTIREQKFTLDPGDRVVLYTDGCIEAMNAKEELLGDTEFYKLVKRNSETSSQALIDVLVRAIDAFAGGVPQSDDITIVTIRREE